MIFKNINLGIIEKYSSYHEINMNIEKDKKKSIHSLLIYQLKTQISRKLIMKTTKLTQPRFTIMMEIII